MTGHENNTRASGANIWPRAIVATFAIFITAMGSWIAFAVRQDMELVGDDYYEREILFQREIDAAQRARVAGDIAVTYNAAEQQITVRVPDASKVADGRIILYRPNDAKLDRQLTLALASDGTQKLDARTLAPGLWKVRLAWKVNSEDYQFDQPLIIGRES